MQDQANDGEIDFTTFAKELELEKLPQEGRETVLADALDALNMRVFTRIIDAMPAEQQEQLKTIAQVDPENVYTIALNTIPKEKQLEMFQEELGLIKEEIKQILAKEGGSQG